MLTELRPDQAEFIALLARATRIERDKLLGNVPEEDLTDIEPSRGERDPTADIALEPLASGSHPARSLGEAIDALTPPARAELYTLMRIGQGQLAAADWERGVSDAARLGDMTVAERFWDDPDLHDHVMKALYEIEALG
jgi:hypothetical protein